jgi:hypothetical protein
MYFRFESHLLPDFSTTETNVRYTTLQWCPETLWRTACKSTAEGHHRIRIWCCTVCRCIQSLCKKKYISWRVHSDVAIYFNTVEDSGNLNNLFSFKCCWENSRVISCCGNDFQWHSKNSALNISKWKVFYSSSTPGHWDIDTVKKKPCPGSRISMRFDLNIVKNFVTSKSDRYE